MNHIEAEITPGDLKRELNAAARDLEKDFLKNLVEDAAGEMQRIMLDSTPTGNPASGGGKHSAVGEPPAIVTRELLTGTRGFMRGDDPVIEFPEQALYLDPVFEDLDEAGGYLNRPFINEGINNALNRQPQNL